MNNKDLFGNNVTDKTGGEIDGQEYAGTIVRETDEAIKFDAGDRVFWVAKSRIRIEHNGRSYIHGRTGDIHQPAIVTIPDWIAKEQEILQ